MKLKLIIIAIGVVLATLGVFLNPFVIVKESEINTYKLNAYNDSVSIAKLSRENILQDSISWSLQQEIDINNANKASREMVISALSAENRRLRNAENTCCEELKHAEETGGIIRDTIRLNIWGKIKRKK